MRRYLKPKQKDDERKENSTSERSKSKQSSNASCWLR